MTVAQINLIPLMPPAPQGVGNTAAACNAGQPAANGSGWLAVAQAGSGGPLQCAVDPRLAAMPLAAAQASKLGPLFSAGEAARGTAAAFTAEATSKAPVLGFAASMIDQLLKQTSDPSAGATDMPEGITAAMVATDVLADDSGQHPAEPAPFDISTAAPHPGAVLSASQSATPEPAPAPSAEGTLTPPVGGQIPTVAGVQTTDAIAPLEGGPRGEPQVSPPVQTSAQSVQAAADMSMVTASDASVVSGDRPESPAQPAFVGITPGPVADEPLLTPTSAQRDPARPGRQDAPTENLSKLARIAPRVDEGATTPKGEFNVRISAVRATLNESSPSNSSAGDAADQSAVPAGAAEPGAVGPAPAASVPELQAARPSVEAEENASLADQVAQSLRGTLERGGREITLRLNPPELGRVRMSLQAEGREVRGLLEADNVRTLGQLQREAPLLMSRLAEAGIQVRRMDFVLADAGQRAPSGGSEHFLPDSQGGQGQTEGDRNDSDFTQAQPAVEFELEMETRAEHQAIVTNEMINVWI